MDVQVNHTESQYTKHLQPSVTTLLKDSPAIPRSKLITSYILTVYPPPLSTDMNRSEFNKNGIAPRASPNMRSTSKAIKLINDLTFPKMPWKNKLTTWTLITISKKSPLNKKCLCGPFYYAKLCKTITFWISSKGTKI